MKRAAVVALLVVLSVAAYATSIQGTFTPSTLSDQMVDVENRCTALEDAKWDDLRFEAAGLNLAGAPAAPGVNTTTYLGALDFAGNAVNDIACQVQMPHNWKNESAVYPHLHVANGSTDAATCTWEFWYRSAEVNGDFSTTYTVATVSYLMPASTAKHVLIPFPAIPMTGLTDSCMMNVLVRRQGAIDSHNANISLLEFDIHYEVDSRGSDAVSGDH